MVFRSSIVMKFEIVHSKLVFYRKWLHSMNDIERTGFVGEWVMQRVIIFEGIVKEVESSSQFANRPIGNYKNYL